MSQMSQWADFIDVTGVKNWYGRFTPEIPDSLPKYLNNVPSFPVIQLSPLEKGLRDFTDNSIKGRNLPYHGTIHFKEVAEGTLAGFDQHYGRPAKNELALVRAFVGMGGYSHDCGHPGATLRYDAPPANLSMPKLGNRVTVEWVTARMVTQFCLDQLVVQQNEAALLPGIALMQAMHFASTYGHGEIMATRRDVPVWVPDVKPTHFISCLMRAADALPPKDFMESMTRGAAVKFGETPATGQRLATVEELIASQCGYYEYLLNVCFKDLDKASPGLSRVLGWRSRVEGHLGAVTQVRNGKNASLRTQIAAMCHKNWGIKQ